MTYFLLLFVCQWIQLKWILEVTEERKVTLEYLVLQLYLCGPRLPPVSSSHFAMTLGWNWLWISHNHLQVIALYLWPAGLATELHFFACISEVTLPFLIISLLIVHKFVCNMSFIKISSNYSNKVSNIAISFPLGLKIKICLQKLILQKYSSNIYK